jgi:hypothetical protein
MTQINLFSHHGIPFGKYFLGIVILVLWFRGCSSDTKSPQIAKVTEVKGFEPKKACS